MRVNALGIIVQECWDEIPVHFPNMDVDAFVVMPNHLHGIIFIHENNWAATNSLPPVGARHVCPVGYVSPLQEPSYPPRGFKPGRLTQLLPLSNPPSPAAPGANWIWAISGKEIITNTSSAARPITNASPVTSSITRSTGIGTRRIPKTPQEEEMIRREIESTDGQIDRLVYKLCGLTEEEIAIVEGKV